MKEQMFTDPMVYTSEFTEHEAAEHIGFELEELAEMENLIWNSYENNSETFFQQEKQA